MKALVMTALLGVLGGCADSGDDSGGSAAGGSGGAEGASCAGLPGPAMVELQTPDGTSYCIDSTEVTQAQYDAFLDDVKSAPGSEHADCVYNWTYQPEQEPGSLESAVCKIGSAWMTPHGPAHCIDWCDAFAYCAWAGKRLCGKAGGGRLETEATLDPTDPAYDATASQWYNACSQGGKTLYPYGDTYDAWACEGRDASTASDGSALPKKNVGSFVGCHGSAEPFDAIFDLSGSVEEMTDECYWSTAHNSTSCVVRGGARETADKITCRSLALPALAMPYIGFRCCKDLP